MTATTVGYGDVTPVTTAGRLLAVALMLGAIGFLLVLAGAVVERFSSAEVAVRRSSCGGAGTR